MQEAIDEQRMAFSRQDGFKKMFDSLQEGIIVMKDGKLNFMNDLSNRLMAEVSGLRSFFLNR